MPIVAEALKRLFSAKSKSTGAKTGQRGSKKGSADSQDADLGSPHADIYMRSLTSSASSSPTSPDPRWQGHSRELSRPASEQSDEVFVVVNETRTDARDPPSPFSSRQDQACGSGRRSSRDRHVLGDDQRHVPHVLGDSPQHSHGHEERGVIDSRRTPGCRLERASVGTSITSDYVTMTPTSSLGSDLSGLPFAGDQPESSLPPTLNQLRLAGDGELARSRVSLASSEASTSNTGLQTLMERRPYSSDAQSFSSPSSSLRSSVSTSSGSRVTDSSSRITSRSSSSTSSATSPLSPIPAVRIVNPFYPADAGPEVMGEMFPQSVLGTPIGALRKSRHRLCLMLNIEQVKLVNDRCPDYRGLADMVGFDTIEIANFWERNPSDTLFMEWTRCRDNRLLAPYLGTLVDCLEKLERQDILEECRGLCLEDARDFIAEQQMLIRYRVQNNQAFDCYVNIADQDILTIGREILDTLEGVYGLRLCLTLRDVTLGGSQFDRMAEMLETRCNSKVLIVLTKSFENSDACQFLVQFAVTLDPGSRRNKLIPLLVDEDAEVPRVLRCLAVLNYYRDKRLGFLWPRLRHAISL